MTSPKPQNYANHRAFDPLLMGMALLTLLLVAASAIAFFRAPDLLHGSVLVGHVLLFLALAKIRLYGVKVQTRVVRLETWLRFEKVLDAKLVAEARQKLTLPQVVALRFAGDAELPGLVRRAIDDNLSPDDIKKSITDWQADWFRV